MSASGQHIALLVRLQQLLHRIYDLRIDYCVADFAITDRQKAALLDADGRSNDEKLLIRPAQDGVDLTLFVAADVLDKLTEDCPFDALHDDNLAEFCVALEGVSHFTYVAWNARFDKRVTLLELELQAEVDKFMAATLLLGSQNAGRWSGALCHRLFTRVRFAADLEAHEQERYRYAHRFASDYCRTLQTRVARGARVLGEVRRFYRLPKLGKIQRIAQSERWAAA